MTDPIDQVEMNLIPIIDCKIWNSTHVWLHRESPQTNPYMVITFDKPTYDPYNLVKIDPKQTYGKFGSWYFTVPQDGEYNIKANIRLQCQINDRFRAMLYIVVDNDDNMLKPNLPTNSPPDQYILQKLGEPGWYTPPMTLGYLGSRLLNLNAGQVVDIRLYLNSNQSDKYMFDREGYVRILSPSLLMAP